MVIWLTIAEPVCWANKAADAEKQLNLRRVFAKVICLAKKRLSVRTETINSPIEHLDESKQFVNIAERAVLWTPNFGVQSLDFSSWKIFST